MEKKEHKERRKDPKYNLERRVNSDCYWFPIVQADKKSYLGYRKFQKGQASEYDCTKCGYKYQFKCPAYISSSEMYSDKSLDDIKH